MNNGGRRKIMYRSTDLKDTLFLVGENRHSHFMEPRSSEEPILKNTALSDPENIL
jgi:hypothetical protein